jgi:hypothetical protein
LQVRIAPQLSIPKLEDVFWTSGKLLVCSFISFGYRNLEIILQGIPRGIIGSFLAVSVSVIVVNLHLLLNQRITVATALISAIG